tara:strand:+ start:1875 stop:2495 length:621 start_codon:yes stop_codon:yes gene_type:complete
MRPQESTDYSGMSREEAMQTMYGVKTTKATPVGFKQGVKEIGMMAAMPIAMFGAPIKGFQLGRAILGSRAYKAYGFVKRPVLSMAVNANVRGAKAAMSISKTYGRAVGTLAALEFKQNVELARQREWKRLGINIFGPPGSLWLYDNYLSNNAESDIIKKDAAKVKSRVGSSLPSKPKTRGKHSYRPGAGKNCAPGYKLINGMCVKK